MSAAPFTETFLYEYDKIDKSKPGWDRFEPLVKRAMFDGWGMHEEFLVKKEQAQHIITTRTCPLTPCSKCVVADFGKVKDANVANCNLEFAIKTSQDYLNKFHNDSTEVRMHKYSVIGSSAGDGSIQYAETSLDALVKHFNMDQPEKSFAEVKEQLLAEYNKRGVQCGATIEGGMQYGDYIVRELYSIKN